MSAPLSEHHELRWGGLAGIGFVVLAIVAYFIAGAPPRTTDPVADIVGYFADNRPQVMTAAFLFAVAAVLLLWFAAALSTALRRLDDTSDAPALIQMGAVFVAALIMVGQAAYGGMAYRMAADAEGNAAAAGLLRSLFEVTAVMYTLIGVAAALPLGAAAVAIARTHLMPMWMAWFAGVVAILGVIAALAVGNTSGALVAGGFWTSTIPFLLTAAWVLAGSLLMVREHLPVVTTTPQAIGHA